MRYNNLMKMFDRPEGETTITEKIPFQGWIIIIVLIGIGWKALWLVMGAFPFNSDEAITGLMARHILQGSCPAFFYGQVYMGSLDAFLTAGLFRVLGESSLQIRILQIALYTCTIITTGWLGVKITRSTAAGLLAALLMAVPVVYVTLYTTVSLGGYGEALVLSNCAFLCTIGLQNTCFNQEENSLRISILSGLLGFITGLGFWVLGLTLVATIPASLFALFAVWQIRKKNRRLLLIILLVFFITFFIGSFAWWQSSFQSGLIKPIQELFGSAISVEQGNWFVRSGLHLLYFLFLGLPAVFGIRPSWEVRWLGLPLIPIVMFIWGLILWRFTREFKKMDRFDRHSWLMLISSMGLLAAGFIFTSFGLDPSGRYFLPLAAPLAIMAGYVTTRWPVRKDIRYGAIVLLLAYHITGTVQSALKNPPGITTQFDAVSWIDHGYDPQLMEFLREEGETRGYSNYWVAYPLAFASREEILFSPRLPYHTDLRYTSRDDRIPEYTRQVERSSSVAYITTFNPLLDQRLAAGFTRLGVTWLEERIGDYHIFYRLSKPVHPADIQSELTPLKTEVNP